MWFYRRLYSDYLFFHAVNKGPNDFHNKVTAAIKLYNDCIDRKGVEACVFDAPLAKTVQVDMSYKTNTGTWRYTHKTFIFLKILGKVYFSFTRKTCNIGCLWSQIIKILSILIKYSLYTFFLYFCFISISKFLLSTYENSMS